MPLTVITLKNVPPSLRGDLSKWMQEIATGVYVGNFNSRIREQIWERVTQTLSVGEATMTYEYRNELGYRFEAINSKRTASDYDGIPIVRIINEDLIGTEQFQDSFSNAAKFHQARKFASTAQKRVVSNAHFIVIDIETDGLDQKNSSIIEIAAIKVFDERIEEFHSFVEYRDSLPIDIVNLTGITNEMLITEGRPIKDVLVELSDFVSENMIVGYGVTFDQYLLRRDYERLGLSPLKNRFVDLIKYVKAEKMFLPNYKFQTVLKAYGYEGTVEHRALSDARMIYELSLKVNKFHALLIKEH